jgi:hypothetical protein
MSIRSRVEDALFLWENGRREGAFLSALIALAATARRQFPDRKTVGDRQAFEQFFTSAHSVRINVEYREKLHPIEHIFYKWLRCELVHEGEIPVDIQLVPDEEDGSMFVRAGGAPEYMLKVSYGWFYHLIHSVVNAPVNADLFKHFTISGS